MIFEFDRNKSEANKLKHGIDFEEAQALWDDPEAYEMPVTVMPETRFLVTGVIKNKFWTAIITKRNNATRLISVRRSRKEEEKNYEKNNQHG